MLRAEEDQATHFGDLIDTLLVLGAAPVNVPALVEISQICHVVAVDRLPARNVELENIEVIALDFSKTSELEKFVSQREFDGVYSLNDHGILPAARLREQRDLPGLKMTQALRFLDKSIMRRVWAKDGLMQPAFEVVESLDEAIKAANRLGYPVIVKPAASGGGGRGVVRVDSQLGVEEAFDNAQRSNRYSSHILVEQLVEGVESSIEIVMFKGEAHLIAMSAKTKAQSRFQVATEIRYPSGFSKEISDRIVSLCQRAAQALGMETGIAHFEVIVSDAGLPSLVEVGARAGGGHTFHPIATYVSSINYPQLVASLSLGRLDVVQTMLRQLLHARSAVYSFPISHKSGVVESIGFGVLDKFRSEVMTEIWRHPGDVIYGLTSSMDRLGCVLTLAENIDDALKDNRRIHELFTLDLRNV